MSKPLEGLNVVEFAGIGPAPFAAMVLAGLGARVTVIARPASASDAGLFGTAPNVLDRDKTILPIDLKSEGGRRKALALIDEADVLIEGFRPGVMEKLQFGPDECLSRNRRLIYGRMTGWGQTGPLAATAGHDLNYIALTGALAAMGPAGGPPTIPLNLVGDFAGGSLIAVLGILAALHERHSSGQGKVIDAAIIDGVSLLTTFHRGLRASGFENEEPGTNLLDGGCPFYRTYRCRDGNHVAIGCLEPQFFSKFAAISGLDPSWQEKRFDRALWPQLEQAIEGIFAARDRDEWAALFEASDACVTPVLTIEEAPAHPHVQARQTFILDGDVLLPVPAPRFISNILDNNKGQVTHHE